MTLQIKNSTETLMSKPATSQTKHDAQEVVANYVKAWHGDLSEREQIDIGVELIRLLGLTENPEPPNKPLSWKKLKELND